MSLQIEWKNLQRNIPGVGSLMGAIVDALREAFFPVLFGGEEVRYDLREILGRSVKCGRLGIPDPRLLAERAYNTSNAACEVLEGSLVGGTDINYVTHKGGICRASADGQKQRELVEKAVISRRKDLAD